MVLLGSALLCYYQRIPNTRSSLSLGMISGAGSSGNGSTFWSIVPCSESLKTCSQSQGAYVCNNPRRQKGSAFRNRRRSNPVVRLLNSNDRVCAPPLSKCIDIILLSSDYSTSTEIESNLTQNSKGKLLVCNKDLVFFEQPVKLAKKKSYEPTFKFQDTWAAWLP
jgi:hypothetical protein